MQRSRPCASALHAFSKSSPSKGYSHRLSNLPGDTVASRTLVRSIFLEDGGCFQTLPAQDRHHERTRRKFEMENDQGRFRAVVMGVVHISIVSIPPLGVIQKLNERNEQEWKGKINREEIRKSSEQGKLIHTFWQPVVFNRLASSKLILRP